MLESIQYLTVSFIVNSCAAVTLNDSHNLADSCIMQEKLFWRRKKATKKKKILLATFTFQMKHKYQRKCRNTADGTEGKSHVAFLHEKDKFSLSCAL